MKIAQIVCTFPPYHGGMGNVAKWYSEILTKLGLDVTVYTPEFQKVHFEDVSSFSTRRFKPIFRFGNAAIIPQLWWNLDSYDIIHLHLPFFGGAEIVHAAFQRRLKGKRFIITYHMDPIANGFLGMFFQWYQNNITPLILESAHKVIVSSYDYFSHSSLAPLLLKRPELFTELPFGVDTTRFQPAYRNHALCEKYHIPYGAPIALFVGGLDRAHHFKGVSILLSAWREIHKTNQDAHLVIVGSGNRKETYMILAQNFGIAKVVHFVGAIAEDELSKWYQSCDIFVFPSTERAEAFGMVLLEAMASGKPIIASNLHGVRTVVIENETGFLVEPKNEKDLEEKIEMLLHDPEKRHVFGEKGRTRVLEKYQWKTIVEKLIEIYENSFDNKSF